MVFTLHYFTYHSRSCFGFQTEFYFGIICKGKCCQLNLTSSMVITKLLLTKSFIKQVPCWFTKISKGWWYETGHDLELMYSKQHTKLIVCLEKYPQSCDKKIILVNKQVHFETTREYISTLIVYCERVTGVIISSTKYIFSRPHQLVSKWLV